MDDETSIEDHSAVSAQSLVGVIAQVDLNFGYFHSLLPSLGACPRFQIAGCFILTWDRGLTESHILLLGPVFTYPVEGNVVATRCLVTSDGESDGF